MICRPLLYRKNDYIKYTVMKNSEEFKGNWDEIKEKLKQQYVQLVDNDFLFAEEKKDELLARLQIKLGKTKEEIQKIISEI